MAIQITFRSERKWNNMNQPLRSFKRFKAVTLKMILLMFWMVGEMCVPFFPLSKWDVNFIKLKGKNQILNTVLASTRWSCCWAPSGIDKLTIVPSKVENIGRNPITIKSMIINTLRVRIRAWLDAQNPASVLMWVPPAAIAKWGLQTPLQTERTFCHFYCFGFVLQLQTGFAKGIWI